jgi:hypothetical protein
MVYVPPGPADLQHVAEELNYTRSQMADLANVSTGRQWATAPAFNNARSLPIAIQIA